MTCIAYRDGVLAGDTEWGDGNIKHQDIKVVKRNGHLIGICGNDTPPLDDVIEWFFSTPEKKKEEFKKVDFAILVIDPSGAIWLLDNRGHSFKTKEKFWAIGSGQEVAMGAMEAGATAKQAVKAAIKWAQGCGGRVVSRSL